MNTSRLPVALGIIGAFVAGIFVGIFVENGPVGVARRAVSPESAANALATETQTGLFKASNDPLRETKEEETTGEELIKRIWVTLTTGDENQRHTEWLQLLSRLSPENAKAIRELFRKMHAQGRRFDFEWDSFWPKWGEIDAAGALACVELNESSTWQPTAAEMIVRGWSIADPTAARAWLAANSTSPFYEGALRGYVDGLARSDLARATTEALSLGAGRDMSKLTEVLAEQALQQRQFNGMIDWWHTLPDDPSDGSARRVAVAHITQRMQLDVPLYFKGDEDLQAYDRAQAWMSELAGSPYRDDDQLGDVAEKVAGWNPASAVEWVASLPPSTADAGHYIGIGRTIRAWGAQDAPATEAWINSLPPSSLRDQSLIAYAEYLRRSQSPGVKQWLAQVQDQSLLQPRAAPTMIYSNGSLRLQGTNLNATNGFIIEMTQPPPRSR